MSLFYFLTQFVQGFLNYFMNRTCGVMLNLGIIGGYSDLI